MYQKFLVYIHLTYKISAITLSHYFISIPIRLKLIKIDVNFISNQILIHQELKLTLAEMKQQEVTIREENTQVIKSLQQV